MYRLKVWNGKKADVDVCDKDCPSRKCFSLGQNKGPYTPGKGYTSYYDKPKWVCMTRHLYGCPEKVEEEEE